MGKVRIIIILLLYLVLCPALSVMAQAKGPILPPAPNVLDSSPIEKSGVTATMVAASLETAGYKMQSIVLRDLAGMLDGLGVLIYVAAGMLALAYLAVYQEYNYGLWFFLGPPLLHAIILTPQKSAGVDWQVGNNQALGVDRINEAINENVNAEISLLFDEWNKLVSSIVQNLVSIIAEYGKDENNTLRHQLKFMTRQQLMDRLFKSRVVDGDLRWLIHQGLKGECSEAVSAARYIALGKRDPHFQGTPEYKQAMQTYTAEFGELEGRTSREKFIGKKIHMMRDNHGYLKKIMQWADGNYSKKKTLGLECLDGDDLSDPDFVLSRPVSCAQLWCWSTLGVVFEIAGEIRKIDQENFKKAREEAPEVYNEIWLSIVKALLPLPNLDGEIDGGGQGKKPAIKTGIPELDQQLDQLFSVKQNRVEPDISIIPVIIGGTLLRKELTVNTDQSLLSRVAEHAGYSREEFTFQPDMSRNQAQVMTERLQASGLSFSKRFEVFQFAMTLPYMQGVILYFLAMTFPFFMLLLLIPGRMSMAFNWLALWGWAKSWDIGWAVVMVVDDILWNLMPKSAIYDPTVDPRHAPISVLESAFHGDPAYNTMLYYSILGVLLTAVPIISAQAVLGGKKVIAGFLVESLAKMGHILGKAGSDWALHSSIVDMNRYREHSAARQTISQLNQDANSALKELRETADMSESLSKVGKGAGVVGALGMVAGGILMATGVGAGVGAWLLLSGAGVMFAGTKAGHGLQTSAKKARVAYNQANAGFHYYNATHSNTYRNMDAIRGGLSGRGEFWVNPESPLGAVKQTMEALLAAKSEQLQYTIEGGVSGVLSAVPIGGSIVSGLAGKYFGREVATKLAGSSITSAIVGKFSGTAGAALAKSGVGQVISFGEKIAGGYALSTVASPVANFLATNGGFGERVERVLAIQAASDEKKKRLEEGR